MTGKRRARKPETILRRARGLVNVARHALNHDRVTGDNWVQVNQALLHALALLSELRAALKASRP